MSVRSWLALRSPRDLHAWPACLLARSDRDDCTTGRPDAEMAREYADAAARRSGLGGAARFGLRDASCRTRIAVAVSEGAPLTSFTASDGVPLAYYIDDFTDPWKQAPILLLLHAAMGSARRYYAWVPEL